jgi:hypothetical protein
MKTDDWRSSIPALACGLLSPYEGKKLFEQVAADMSTEVGETLHRALRSMAVFVVSQNTPSWTISGWAIELKPLIAAVRKSFPVIAEKILSLRCMLLEAAELAEMKDTELPDRPGVTELVRLLASAETPMSSVEIGERLGGGPHAIANRIRIAIASGSVSVDHGDWQKIRLAYRQRPLTTDGIMANDI